MSGLLGIECGATHTVALHESGGKVARAGFGPANLRLLNNTQLAKLLRQIAKHGTMKACSIPAGIVAQIEVAPTGLLED